MTRSHCETTASIRLRNLDAKNLGVTQRYNWISVIIALGKGWSSDVEAEIRQS